MRKPGLIATMVFSGVAALLSAGSENQVGIPGFLATPELKPEKVLTAEDQARLRKAQEKRDRKRKLKDARH